MLEKVLEPRNQTASKKTEDRKVTKVQSKRTKSAIVEGPPYSGTRTGRDPLCLCFVHEESEDARRTGFALL